MHVTCPGLELPGRFLVCGSLHLLLREGLRETCSIEASTLQARCFVASEPCSHTNKMLRMASKKAGAAAVACAGLAGCRA